MDKKGFWYEKIWFCKNVQLQERFVAACVRTSFKYYPRKTCYCLWLAAVPGLYGNRAYGDGWRVFTGNCCRVHVERH